MDPGGKGVDRVSRGRALPGAMDSVLDRLDRQASEAPAGKALVLVETGAGLTWRQLRDGTLDAAAWLRSSGIRPAELVGVLRRNDERFMTALLGLWRLGAVGVPMPIPGTFADPRAYAEHLGKMIEAAGIRTVVGDPSLAGPHIEMAIQRNPDVRWLDAGTWGGGAGFDSAAGAPPGSELALVQYTSGSTSAPKGVELTHQNISAAVAAFGQATELRPGDAWAVWMPLFHDFALISTLTALAHGATVWMWQPARFIRQPGRWVAEFGRNRLTHYSGPNFSFNLMLAGATDDVLEGVDLSGWKVAVSGGEQISAATVRRFTERFGQFGFRPEAMVPGYGMAEATLAVTVTPLGTRPRWLTVSRDALTDRGEAEQVPPEHAGARDVVCVGVPAPGIELRVTDELGQPFPERRVGEIEISGPSVSRGYRGHPDAASDGWFATGDLGFVDAGGLFIVGRLKDVVNVRGMKYHPEDLEPVVAAIDGVRRCCVVGEGETDEHIAVIAETRAARDHMARLREEIRDSLARLLGLFDIRVYLVEPHTILMTSSGKLRRQLMRRRLERGELVDLESMPLEHAAVEA